MRRLIGPPHAHRDGPCEDSCYEEVPDWAGPLSDLALRLAATRVRAARPGIEQHTALAVIDALVAMGWRPSQLRVGYDDTTLDKVRAGLRKFDPFLDEEALTGIISCIQNEGILFRERTP